MESAALRGFLPDRGHEVRGRVRVQGAHRESGIVKPELKSTKPRVYYLNIPKKFIAGTVYDPVAKEVIIGATCTLTGPKAKTYTALTDAFGDFWFQGLPDGDYTMKIEAKGFAAKSFDKMNLGKDINLGDIPLAKAGKK